MWWLSKCVEIDGENWSIEGEINIGKRKSNIEENKKKVGWEGWWGEWKKWRRIIDEKIKEKDEDWRNEKRNKSDELNKRE